MIDPTEYEKLQREFSGITDKVVDAVHSVVDPLSAPAEYVSQVFITDLTARAFGLGILVGWLLAVLAAKII